MGWMVGMLALPLAFIQAMSAVAADETQVANYVPWFPRSEVPMINGPKCLDAQINGSS
jgi:hypothetical protein